MKSTCAYTVRGEGDAAAAASSQLLMKCHRKEDGWKLRTGSGTVTASMREIVTANDKKRGVSSGSRAREALSVKAMISHPGAYVRSDRTKREAEGASMFVIMARATSRAGREEAERTHKGASGSGDGRQMTKTYKQNNNKRASAARTCIARSRKAKLLANNR